MAFEIRELDIADDAQLRRWHEINTRAEKEDGRPWTIVWRLDEMAQSFRQPDPTERIEGFCAYDGDRMVGAAVAWFFLTDNTDKIWTEVFVEPEERRRGIGSALVEAIVDRARAEGRTRVAGESTYAADLRETAPTLKFAEKHGFHVANTEITRSLALPVADGLLKEIVAESAPHHEGYEIASYVGTVPDSLIASYCWLHNQLAVEAPSGDFNWEEESLTPEVLTDKLRKLSAVGRSKYTTLASKDGEVVAFTDVVVTRDDKRAQQWYTIVAPEHRGHRLGAAVKARNLQLVVAALPDLDEIVTSNAETNANMVEINDRLGFVPVAVCPGFLREL